MIQSVVDSVVSYRRNFSETCGGQTFFLFLSVPLSLLDPSYHISDEDDDNDEVNGVDEEF